MGNLATTAASKNVGKPTSSPYVSRSKELTNSFLEFMKLQVQADDEENDIKKPSNVVMLDEQTIHEDESFDLAVVAETGHSSDTNCGSEAYPNSESAELLTITLPATSPTIATPPAYEVKESLSMRIHRKTASLNIVPLISSKGKSMTQAPSSCEKIPFDELIKEVLDDGKALVYLSKYIKCCLDHEVFSLFKGSQALLTLDLLDIGSLAEEIALTYNAPSQVTYFRTMLGRSAESAMLDFFRSIDEHNCDYVVLAAMKCTVKFITRSDRYKKWIAKKRKLKGVTAQVTPNSVANESAATLISSLKDSRQKLVSMIMPIKPSFARSNRPVNESLIDFCLDGVVEVTLATRTAYRLETHGLNYLLCKPDWMDDIKKACNSLPFGVYIVSVTSLSNSTSPTEAKLELPRIVYSNPILSAMLDYDNCDIEDRPCDFFHCTNSETDRILSNLVNDSLSTGEEIRTYICYVTKKGSTLESLLAVKPIRDTNNVHIFSLCCCSLLVPDTALIAPATRTTSACAVALMDQFLGLFPDAVVHSGK